MGIYHLKRYNFQPGDKIRIKTFEELSPTKQLNVTIEFPKKRDYLGRILTVKNYYGEIYTSEWCCITIEDEGKFCWFDDMISVDVGTIEQHKYKHGAGLPLI